VTASLAPTRGKATLAIGACSATSATPDHDRDHQRAGQRPVDLGAVAGAGGLGRQTRRGKPQGTKGPEQEVEDHRAECDRAEKMGLAQATDGGRGDQSEQGRGHMRKRHRPGEREHAAVADVRGGGAWLA
jgi:hypothetical protein